MSTKKKPTKTPDATPLKFTKGGFYLDQKGELWCCANAKRKKCGDFQFSVPMQRTEMGEAVGGATQELVDAFAKQLSAAELKEYRAVCQRERDAEEAAKSTPAPTKKTKSAKATTKPADQPKAKKVKPASDEPKKMSALDAAAKVLAESGEPMAAKAMIDAMANKGYWTSPGGKTPQATLYAAILREIQTKGADARFQKTERGHFAINAGANAPEKLGAKATGKKAAKKKAGDAKIADGTPGPKAVSDLFKI